MKAKMNLDELMEDMGFGGGKGEADGTQDGKKTLQGSGAKSLAAMGVSASPVGAGKGLKTPILPQKDDYSDWSQLAELILEAEIRDEIATGIQNQKEILKAEREGTLKELILPAPIDVNMKSLGLKVATGVEELLGMRDSISPDTWIQKKMERVVRMEQVRNRLSNYAELEFIAIQRLMEQADHGKITDPAILMAIAALGAKMTHLAQIREDSMTGNKSGSGHLGPSVSIDMQINQINGVSPTGDLPGPGELAPIRLNLSHRIQNQLAKTLPASGSDGESYLDGIEMLTAKEVKSELLGEKPKTIDHEEGE